jgi:ribosomal protein S1
VEPTKSEKTGGHRSSSQNLFTSTHKSETSTPGESNKRSGRVRSSSAKKTRASSSTQGSSAASSHAPYTGMRKAEELTGKRLRVGLHVLARVRRIASKQIVLSLPSGFTGYCRAADINDEVASALQHETEDDEDSNKVEAQNSRLSRYFVPGQYVFATISHVASGTDENLVVTSGGGNGNESSKRRRIYVSLRPDAFNAGISFSTLKIGTVICGFIRSHQDHGYIIATGIEGVSTTFLPFSACDGTNGVAGVMMQKDAPSGFPVLCTVSAINRGSRTITLACNSSTISSTVSKDSLHTIYTIKPGMLFDCTIDRTLPNGLAVSFLQYFRGSVALAHLSSPATQFWASQYKIGDAVSARVLFTDPLEKIIALSIAPHIVKLGFQMAVPRTRSFGVGGPDYNELVEGSFIDDAKVVRIDPGSGVLVSWGKALADKASNTKAGKPSLEAQLETASQWGSSAYIHISRVADKKVESLEKMFKVGSSHRVRLLGFSGIEGMAQGSMRPSVLNASVMRADDVKVGDIVEGTVSRVFIDRPDDPTSADRAAALVVGKGAVATIKIGEGVSGTIFALHVADVLPVRSFQTLKLRKRFFESLGLVEGQKQRCRVLTIDKNSGRIQLTLKKSLVQATSLVTSFESAAQALSESKDSTGKDPIATGFITGLRDSGIIVTFCGDAHGFVPVSDLIAAGVIPADEAIETTHDGKVHTTIPNGILSTAYSLGQVIKVRIVSVNVKKMSMRLSVSLSENDKTDAAELADLSKLMIPESDLPSAGDYVDGIVERFESGERLIIRIVTVRSSESAPKGLFAELSMVHATDHSSLISSLSASSSIVQPGVVLKGLLVLSRLKAKEHGSPQLSVSAKPLLLLASKRDRMIPKSIDSTESGQLVAGYVASVTAFGAFIRFLDGVTALAPRSRWPKIYQDPSGSFEIKKGQSILAVIDRVSMADGGAENKSRVTVSLLPETVARSLSSSYFLKNEHDSDLAACSALFSRPQGDTFPDVSDASTFLRGLLIDEEFSLCSTPIRAIVDDENALTDTGDVEAIPCRFVYRPGAVTKAKISSVTNQGLILEFPAPSMTLLRDLGVSSKENQKTLPCILGFAETPQDQAAVKDGSVVDVRILDVDAEKGIVVAEVIGQKPPKQKKQKRSESHSALESTLPSSLDAPLSTNVGEVLLPQVGSVVNATVVHHRKSSHYAVVSLEGSNALAFAATSDFILSGESLSLQEGQNVSVVITQVPNQGKSKGPSTKISSKGKNKLSAATAAVAAAVTSTIDGMILCTAVPCVVSQRQQILSPSEKKSSNKRLGTSIAKIVPGMLLSATVVKKHKKKKNSTSFTRADNEDDEEDEDDDDDDVADDNDIDEEDELDPAASLRSNSLALNPLNLRLEGVHGAYIARLSLSECIDFDPILGTSPKDAPKKGVSLFKTFVPGSLIHVKVVSVSRVQREEGEESATPAPKSGKRPRSDSLSRASALYFINVTVRKSDLDLVPMHLSYPRCSWPTDFPVQSSSTVYEHSEDALAKAGITSYVKASSSLSVSMLHSDESTVTEEKVTSASFCAGSTGYGIVEGLNESATHLLIGLGGSLRGRVPIFEAGDNDSIRDPSTGDLLVSSSAAFALSARNILKTHSLGSVVPVVVLSIDPTHYHRADLSIRRSRAAIAYAATESTQTKKRPHSALVSPFVSMTSSVNSWMTDAVKRETSTFAAVGGVTLTRVVHNDPSFPATLPEDPQRQDLELAPVPATSTFFRVVLPGGSRGVVDITQVADRASWKRSQCGRYKDGDVVLGVILGSKSVIESGLNVSLRESFVNAALESQSSLSGETDVTLSGKKRKSKVMNSQEVPTFAAAAIRLQKLEDVENAAVMTVGTKVSGFIINTSAKGCFVRLSQAVTARVQLSELSDRYVAEPATSFPPGRLVTGKVTSSSAADDSSIRRVDLTLKKSIVEGIPKESITQKKKSTIVASLGFSELTAGDVFDATLTKVADFGLFVALDGTDRFKDENIAKGRAQARLGTKITPISGLVHSSEVFDDEDVSSTKKGGEKSKKRINLGDRFSVGDRMRVVIVEVDAEQKKLSLSVKPSRLMGIEQNDEEGDDDSEEEIVDEDEMNEDDEDSDEDEDADADLDEGNNLPENEEGDDDSELDMNEDEEEGEHEEEDDKSASGQGIFSLLDELQERSSKDTRQGAKASATSKVASLSKEPKASAKTNKNENKAAASFGWSNDLEGISDGIEKDEEHDDGNVAKGTKPLSKQSDRRSHAVIAAEEEETRRLEARLASGEADENPETKEDFERLVLSTPGSSMSWIKYMAWHLSLGEIDAVRRVADRALSTIPYREEAEKLNIWTAWMNLEAQHGTKASLSKIFARALAAADQRSVYTAMLNVLQKGGDERAAECDALFATATKKFGSDSISLWNQWASFRFRRGNPEGVTAVLQSANAVLPKDLQVDLTVQIALLQYRFAPGSAVETADGFDRGSGVGSAEVGRSMIEVVLSAAPKRLDIWNVYIDAEIRAAQSASISNNSSKSSKAAKSSGKIQTDDLKYIRGLFERVIRLPQSSKKMKFLLKRYATFESEHGDERGLARVREVAKEYVSRTTGEENE